MNGHRTHRTCGTTILLLKTCRLLFILGVLVLALLGRQAFAATYDDFSSGTIDTSKWTITDTGNLFSVVPGSSVSVPQGYVLHISSTGNTLWTRSSLITKSSGGSGFLAGINFFNYTQSGYTPPLSDPSTPSVSLVLSAPGNHVFVVGRAVNASGQMIAAKEYNSDGTTMLNKGTVPFSATSGALLIAYSENQISLGYSTSTNPDEWADTFTVVATFSYAFSAPVHLWITGASGGGGTMSVDVGGLYYSSQLPKLLQAPSITYDDFSSGSIDITKWTVTDTNNFFGVVPGSSVNVSQSDVLQFTGTGSSTFPLGYLQTTSSFDGDFFAGTNFFNFTASGYTPASTDPHNPGVFLSITGGATDPAFRVTRVILSSGDGGIGWRELDSSGNTLLRGSWPYSGSSGSLLIAYMNNRLSLGYSTSTDPHDWASSFRAVATFPVIFSVAPTLKIVGSGGGGGSVSANTGGLYYYSSLSNLSVTKPGTGSGTVTSTPAGIDCGATCSASFSSGTAVTLTATPATGSDFTGWSGACSGTGDCNITMNSSVTVTATFTLKSYTLNASKTGTGSGTLSASGLSCSGASCSGTYGYNTAVVITATPGTGSTFGGWTGCDQAGAGSVKGGTKKAVTKASKQTIGAKAAAAANTCTVTMTGNKTVSAAFTLNTYTVSASVPGGHGTVAPSSQSVGYGSSATLTITPDKGYEIESITDNGQSVARVSPYVISNVAAGHTVVISFSTNRFLTLGINGPGKVTSSPSGIDCGATCSAEYKSGTRVTLTPIPDDNSVFTGWTGACTGTGTCSVAMSADKTVGAAFSSGSCTYTLSPESRNLAYKGGAITIRVTASDHSFCLSPGIQNNTDWITYATTPFVKNKGSIKLTIPALDSSVGRSGTLTIGGRTFTVSQTGKPCTMTLAPPSSPLIPKAGGSGSFTVTVTPSDCAWSLAPDITPAWIHATAGSGGVGYTVDENTGTRTRTGKIVATLALSKKSKSFTVKQGK